MFFSVNNLPGPSWLLAVSTGRAEKQRDKDRGKGTNRNVSYSAQKQDGREDSWGHRGREQICEEAEQVVDGVSGPR